MPYYSYKCPTCGETFEAMRKIDDRDTIIHCPHDGWKAKRLIDRPQAVWSPTTGRNLS